MKETFQLAQKDGKIAHTSKQLNLNEIKVYVQARES